jgi:hypothetical protein
MEENSSKPFCNEISLAIPGLGSGSKDNCGSLTETVLFEISWSFEQETKVSIVAIINALRIRFKSNFFII